MSMTKKQIEEATERIKKEMAERMERAKDGDSVIEGLLRTGAMNAEAVNALLYVIGMILDRESDKYKAMEVTLSYSYIPIDRKFTNVITYSYKANETERRRGEICFEKTADFLDIMADLLAILKQAGKDIKPTANTDQN